jgi:hypothetical protein
MFACEEIVFFVDAHFSNSTRLHDTFFKKQALTSRYFSATVLTTISIMMRLPDRTFHPSPPTAASSLAQRQRQNQSQTSFRRSLFPLGGCALRFVKLSAFVGAWGVIILCLMRIMTTLDWKFINYASTSIRKFTH